MIRILQPNAYDVIPGPNVSAYVACRRAREPTTIHRLRTVDPDGHALVASAEQNRFHQLWRCRELFTKKRGFVRLAGWIPRDPLRLRQDVFPYHRARR